MSFTNFTETRNRAAADLCEWPSSTNATTRSRSSTGSGLPIPDPHICHANSESQISAHGNPESDKPQPALVAETAPQDVTLYKSGTIRRRIARRMAIAGCAPTEVDRYLAMLRADKRELAQLSADLLIHVTSFFRDPAAFEQLSAIALPALIATQPPDRPLRVWVAGCSTE